MRNPDWVPRGLNALKTLVLVFTLFGLKLSGWSMVTGFFRSPPPSRPRFLPSNFQREPGAALPKYAA